MRTIGIIVYFIGVVAYFYNGYVSGEVTPSDVEIALFLMITGTFNVALAKKDKWQKHPS